MNEQPTTYKKELKKDIVCRVKIVRAGFPDHIIKITPAAHESETVWVDTREGAERWEVIKRMLQTSTNRNTPVPMPASMHSDPSDLRHPDLKEEDIPVAKLEGVTFEPSKE